MSAPREAGRLSRFFRQLLPGDMGAEVCDELDRQQLERRAQLGAAVAWLWLAAHLLLPQTWVLALMLRRREREPRRKRWGLGVSWLDVKLGLRMLRLNPGLTIVAVFALSIGIPASLIPIHGMDAMSAPLPFDEADRIVGLRNRNIVDGRTEAGSLHDFFVWREALTTLEAVAAAKRDPYNVISEDGRAAPVVGSEITASAFRILRVPPFLGRVLLDADEVPGAPDVVVLSYELWQSRLGGDPDVLGKTIRIGTTPHAVVGVMPEGFLFPVRDFLWMPLRDRPTDFERGTGPNLIIFGRLADGVSIADARAELETMGARMASEYPDTHQRLRPQVSRYTAMWGPHAGARAETYLVELIAIAMLMIVCGNIGTLILARTATRSGEIAVRTALGASRGRIVSQLFVESLVLAVVSAGLGLFVGDFVGNAFQREILPEGPFWFDLGVKPRTAVLALSVAALCAVIAGVLPALRATGRGVQLNLQGARTGSRMRFGGASTFLIVAEVAIAVGFLTVVGTMAYALLRSQSVESTVEPNEYLMATVRMPWTDDSAVEVDLRVAEIRNLAAVHRDLLERLSGEPDVRGVAMGNRLPEMEHPRWHVELEGEDRGADFRGHRVNVATVDIGFFDGLGQPILSGRGFTTADLPETPGKDRTAVIVNTAFMEHVLGGRNPIGRRVRYVVPADQEPGPWYEIVGVVGHLGMNALTPARDEGMYFPAAPGELHPILMAIHLSGDPLAFVPRLRRIASEVDPRAMIQGPRLLSDAPNLDKTVNLYSLLLLAFVCGTAIVLSGAGLYALMSFTVSQRTREIGIRTALGARPQRILVAIGRRAFLQLAAGIAAGAALGIGLFYALLPAYVPAGPDLALTLAACSGFMLLVGLLACLGPTLRGLRIQPVEALKDG